MSQEVEAAMAAWKKASPLFRMQGEAIMGPLLAAVVATDARVSRVEAAIQDMIQGGALHGES